jgi:enoyl-CoA hydratase
MYGYFKYEVDRKEKIATVTQMPNARGQDVAPSGSEIHLVELINEWERDDDVKVVIIKSGGENFAHGHDLTTYLDDHAADDRSRAEKAKAPSVKRRRTNREPFIDHDRWMVRLMTSLKPTIAQVHGMCVEYGMGLQMHCDMTIASDDAHFGHLGQVAGMSGLVPTVHYITAMGYKRFREMMVSGRTYSGQQAVEMGLCNRVVPRAKLDEETWKEAKRIAIIPLDGLVTGKMSARLGLMNMGINLQSEMGGVMWAGFMPNVKHEPDEFHFFDVVREQGLGAGIRARQAQYDPLGGLGAKAEQKRY